MSSLKSKVIEQLSRQIFKAFELGGFPSVINLKFIEEWLDGSSELLGSRAEKSLAEKSIKSKFTIEGLTFYSSEASETELYDCISVLNKVGGILFYRCRFSCRQLKGSSFVGFFEVCEFLENWLVLAQGKALSLIGEDDSLYLECDFKGEVLIYHNYIDVEVLEKYSVVFENCKIPVLQIHRVVVKTHLWIDYTHDQSCFLLDINVDGSKFECDFNLSRAKPDKISLNSSVFYQVNLSMISPSKLTVEGCEFKGECNFKCSTVKDFVVLNSNFNARCDLSCAEIDELMIANSSFGNVLNFNSIKVKESICLEALHFSIPPDFSYCEFSGVAIAGSVRETWRIMKHALDNVGDKVEAGHYYALEMQAYQRELRTKKWYDSERVLLKANSVISNHGQNYYYPIIWLVLTMIVTSLLIANQQHQLLSTPDVFLPLTRLLNSFAQGFLPIRAIAGEDNKGISFLLLLSSVFTSVFVWHLLVAIRRHSKK